MNARRFCRLCALGPLLAGGLLAPGAPAQLQVSNSATLTLTRDGTNLLLRADFDTTNGAFTLLQADRLDALRLPPCACQISNQIHDLNWVPPERTRSWTLPQAGASNRFFRLLLEPVLSRGRALVWKDDPIDWDATRALYGEITNAFIQTGTNEYGNPVGYYQHTPVVMKQPQEVWLDHLGTYDTNGVLVGSNEGKLTGFYGTTRAWSVLPFVFPELPQLSNILSASNDFRVDYTGASNGDPRASLVAASEVNFYWAINDYRTRFFNDAFITELNLPPEIDANMRSRQYRPDLSMSGTLQANRPILWAEEQDARLDAMWLYPQANHMTATVRSAYTHPLYTAS
jgi:hypothetical protein